METITIISAIISLIVLILFFILVYDVNQIKRELNSLNLRNFLKDVHKRMDHYFPEIKQINEIPPENIACPKCGFKYPIRQGIKEIHCSFCNTDFPVIPKK